MKQLDLGTQAHLENGFNNLLVKINNLVEKRLDKAQKIRVNLWVKKLNNVVDNLLWKKNRNLYAQTLYIMLKNDNIEAPFNHSPEDGPLPKLTLYDIPYNIRQQIQAKKNYLKNFNKDKENNNIINQFRSKRQSQQFNNSIQLSIKKQLKQNQIKPKKAPKLKEQKNQSIIIQKLKETLHFLAQNHRYFQKSQDYKNILLQIVEFGDQFNYNFRQLQFSMIE